MCVSMSRGSPATINRDQATSLSAPIGSRGIAKRVSISRDDKKIRREKKKKKQKKKKEKKKKKKEKKRRRRRKKKKPSKESTAMTNQPFIAALSTSTH
eukprot:jgi/Bigna1/140031/aug1.53_g14739